MRERRLLHDGRRGWPERAAIGLVIGATAVGGGLGAVFAVPASGAARAGTRSVPVSVTPASGRPGQSFRVALRRPEATGGSGVFRRHDAVTVNGPRRHGCVSAAQVALPDGPAGQRAAVTLNPRHLGGRWCTGRFTGTVTQSETMRCTGGPTPQACPFLVIAPQTIGRFHFRVGR